MPQIMGEVSHPEGESRFRFINTGSAINWELPDLREIVGRDIGIGIWVTRKWAIVHQSRWIHFDSRKLLLGIQIRSMSINKLIILGITENPEAMKAQITEKPADFCDEETEGERDVEFK